VIYERRTVLTLQSLPPVNAGYEGWFPELRRQKQTVHATTSASGEAYPKRWFPDAVARLAKRADRPRVAR
jgi:hypothetical protein